MIQRAELLLMARMLHCSPESLSMLLVYSDTELRHLRRQIETRLSREGQAAVVNLSAAGRMLPARLSAKIAERALGPVITAEMARRLDSTQSGKVACHLSAGFMADVARYLPAEESASLINGLPIEILRLVTHELARRGETIVLATLVASLHTEAIVALASELDAETLADTALLMPDPAPLAAALGRFAPAVLAQAARYLPDQKIAEIIGGLSEELLHSVALELERSRDFDELARLAALLPDATLAHLAENVAADTLIQIASRAGDPGQLAESLIRVAPHMLAQIIDRLPEDVAASLMERLDPRVIEDISRELEAAGDEHVFTRLFRFLPFDPMLTILGVLREKTMETVLRNRQTAEHVVDVLQHQARQRRDLLLGYLPEALRTRIAKVLPGKSPPDS